MRRTACLAILGLLLVSAAWAQEPPPVPAAPAVPAPPAPPAPPRPAFGKWWKNSRIVQELQLSESQVKRLEDAFLASRKDLSELNTELSSQETQLQALLDADPMDETKVKEETERVLSVRAKMERANTNMMLSFRRILSTEQWKKLDQSYRSSGGLASTPPKPPAPPKPPMPPKPPVPADTSTLKQVGKTPEGEAIYAISGAIKAPTAVRQPLPAYTPEAREKKIEGTVVLEAVVRKDGRAFNVRVNKGLGYGLDEAAIAKITNDWLFQPGTLDGKPVNVRAYIELSFRLY